LIEWKLLDWLVIQKMKKISIADKYLLPKQIKDNGVKENEMKLEDNIIQEVIRSYTKESGVRNLEREISKLARKVVKKSCCR
jgi:ATP-dependent Lon protease